MSATIEQQAPEQQVEQAPEQPEWINCVIDDDYEIDTAYPYTIRRKSNHYVVSEHYHNGYLRLSLNAKKHFKHDVVARQFIPNDDPEHKTQVDHINHVRSDNHISNLRWVSSSTNNRNRTSYKGRTVEYLDELSDEAFEVDEYNHHQFEDLWFDPDTNTFYYYTGAAYREISYSVNNTGVIYIKARDSNNVTASITLNKFKRIYNLN